MGFVGSIGAFPLAVWPLAWGRNVSTPRNDIVDLAVTIICGLGLLLATVAIVENPLIAISVVLIGTVFLIAERTSRTVARPWSPFHWVRMPQWRLPSLWHHPQPYWRWSSPQYYPYYVYSPAPRDGGWMRHDRLPTQA
jgi:hypothetical protein